MCVINNGHVSRYFSQERGLHQGCGLSGTAFLYCAELMVIKILNDKRIKGIKLDEEIETLEQYADDTSIISLYEQKSIEAIIEVFDELYKHTGLKVNYDKTTIFPVGSATKNRKRMYLTKKFKWAAKTVEILGIIINLEDLDDVKGINLSKVLEKARNVLNSWQNRYITLSRKITVINSLCSFPVCVCVTSLPSTKKYRERDKPIVS